MSDDDKIEGIRHLFTADTDHEPGENNVNTLGFDVHPYVFFVSGFVIVAFVLLSVVFTEQAGAAYEWAFASISEYFNWFYVIAANLIVIAVLYFALSRYGNIRIGGVDAEKEFSDISWLAMLFSAGMGIGLMFFSVAEPLWHFDDPLFGLESQSEAAAEMAMVVTYFHWGFHPWAIYGLVGLSLAFFMFNKGLPLTFRSVFWPVLGDRIYGWPGHVIDVLTVFATLFGITTSLGLGAQQINAGLSFLGEEVLGTHIPVATSIQLLIIAVITTITVVSVLVGLEKGMRRLSNLNIALILVMMGLVLLIGPALFVVSLFPQALGSYLSQFFELSTFTNSFGGVPYEGWQGSWTVFYWGWWIAWSPFVGMFIARISRGRTVREFVFGVLFVPALFSFTWMATLGGSALHFELFTESTIVETVTTEGEEVAMFELFTMMPLTLVLSGLAVILVTTFFVTSADSGSMVLGHLSSGGKHDSPRNQRVSWAIAEGAIASVLLLGGGLTALQTASITAGLPFALVLLFMAVSLKQGLQEEYEILNSEEFAGLIEELEESGEIEVNRTGGDVVTDLEPADSRDVPEEGTTASGD